MKEIASLTLVCAVVWNVAVGLNENLDMVSPTGFPPLFKLSFSSPGPFLSLSPLSLSLSLSLSLFPLLSPLSLSHRPLHLLSLLSLSPLSLSLCVCVCVCFSLSSFGGRGCGWKHKRRWMVRTSPYLTETRSEFAESDLTYNLVSVSKNVEYPSAYLL